MLIMGDQHFVARIPIEPVREDVHSFGCAMGEENLVGTRVDKRRQAVPNFTDLVEQERVVRVARDFRVIMGAGLAHPIRGRAGRPVIEERDSIVQREKGMDLLPVRGPIRLFRHTHSYVLAASAAAG